MKEEHNLMLEQRYDKHGNPITWNEWVAIVQNQPDHKRVAETDLPDGKWVSTVWLGLDYSFSGEGPPIIFETMVFPARDNWRELDMDRYSTPEEAEEGHQRMVEKMDLKEKDRLSGGGQPSRSNPNPGKGGFPCPSRIHEYKRSSKGTINPAAPKGHNDGITKTQRLSQM